MVRTPCNHQRSSRIGYTHFGCGFDQIFWVSLPAKSTGSNSVGLTAYFKHSRFVGYSYGPPYGGPRTPAVRHGIMLVTSQGL